MRRSVDGGMGMERSSCSVCLEGKIFRRNGRSGRLYRNEKK